MPDGLWVTAHGGICLEFLNYKFCNDREAFRRNASIHATSLMPSSQNEMGLSQHRHDSPDQSVADQ